MDHYQVKFTGRYGKETKPTVHYGIVDNFNEEALPAGQVLVTDAILPTCYRVPEASLIDLPLGFGPENEFHQHVHKAYKMAREVSKALPKGVHVGKLFSIPVADGSAWYIITKVNKKTVKVEWRGFCPDRWIDQRFGYMDTVPISQVEPYVRWMDSAKASLSRLM